MKKLAEFGTAEEAHGYLDGVAAQNPLAECRIDPESEKPHQVWSGPIPASRGTAGPTESPAEPGPVAVSIGDDQLDRLADAILERLEKRGK